MDSPATPATSAAAAAATAAAGGIIHLDQAGIGHNSPLPAGRYPAGERDRTAAVEPDGIDIELIDEEALASLNRGVMESMQTVERQRRARTSSGQSPPLAASSASSDSPAALPPPYSPATPATPEELREWRKLGSLLHAEALQENISNTARGVVADTFAAATAAVHSSSSSSLSSSSSASSSSSSSSAAALFRSPGAANPAAPQAPFMRALESGDSPGWEQRPATQQCPESAERVLKTMVTNLRHARGRVRSARKAGSRELAKHAAARRHLEAQVEAEAENRAACQRRLEATEALVQERDGAALTVQQRLDAALAGNAAIAAELKGVRSDYAASQLEVRDLAAEVQGLAAENERLRGEVDKAEAATFEQKQAGEVAAAVRKEKLTAIQQRVVPGLRGISSSCKALCVDVSQSLKLAAADFRGLSKGLVRSVRKLEKNLEEAKQRADEESTRRKLTLNELHNARGNIRVICRVPPVRASTFVVEGKGGEDGELQKASVTVASKSEVVLAKTARHGQRAFDFDHVFDGAASQTDVFKEVSPFVESAMDGYHVCIFAYGQTGSGKTYTMEGPREDPGINHRALDEMFRIQRERSEESGGMTYELKLSIIEIYNEVRVVCVCVCVDQCVDLRHSLWVPGVRASMFKRVTQ